MGIAEFVIGFIMLIAGAAISANQKRSDRDWQEDMYEKQLEDQREDRQTEYQLESPVALAQQYKSAGLNPLGINAGNGSVNHVASSMPQTNSSSSYFDPLSTIQGAASMAFQSKQMKLQETNAQLLNEKTRAETFNIWQDGMAKQIENGYKPELLQETINQIRQDIEKKKVDKQLGEMQINFLEDAMTKGINPVVDDHNESVARFNHLNSQSEYIQAQTATVNALREGQVTAQTLQNMSSVFEYELRKKFGEDMANLEYRDFKQEVERNERLRNVYDELVKNEQAKAAYDAAMSKISYYDFAALPSWQRYLLSLGKEVVSKGAELAF